MLITQEKEALGKQKLIVIFIETKLKQKQTTKIKTANGRKMEVKLENYTQETKKRFSENAKENKRQNQTRQK
jgi:hypothetical protein